MSPQLLFSFGIMLVFVGFIIVFVAVILMFFASARGEGNVKAGGVVFIGPFPVIFGTDRESVKTLLILSITLIVITIIATAIFQLSLK